jgi:hypothetical protein
MYNKTLYETVNDIVYTNQVPFIIAGVFTLIVFSLFMIFHNFKMKQILFNSIHSKRNTLKYINV